MEMIRMMNKKMKILLAMGAMAEIGRASCRERVCVIV